MRPTILFFVLICFTFSCKSPPPPQEIEKEIKPQIFTPYSTLENTYHGFHSPHAINAIAKIENEYFNAYEDKTSSYYGTVWESYAKSTYPYEGFFSIFEAYHQILDTVCATPLHCTIYANQALQAGLGDTWQKLSELHERQWRKREYAGWSIAYLLCKHFEWKAYLIIDESSPEYDVCKKAFRKNQTYPVYKQPDIPLAGLLELGKDDTAIQELLAANEFGWGFSYQGWHTWITRFEDLKECYWGGAPSQKMASPGAPPLFLKTPFLAYHDYASHVICFPPKIKDSPSSPR